jgi:hypothetical protein
VKPLFEKQFTIYAIARRGRGETDGTEGHSLEDESRDIVAVIQSIGEELIPQLFTVYESAAKQCYSDAQNDLRERSED